MKKLSKNEKEFIQLIQNLWKKKFIIFVICLLFTLIGFVSNYLTPKKYQSRIHLKSLSEIYLSEFSSIINNRDYQIIINEFNNSYKINLKTSKNLKLFASLTNDKNFKDNIDEIKVELLNDILFFYFPSRVDGEKILIDYLNFTGKILIEDLKKKLNLLLVNKKSDLLLKNDFQKKIYKENEAFEFKELSKAKIEILNLNEFNKLNQLATELNEFNYKLDNFNKLKWDLDFFHIATLETKLISGNFKIVFPIAGFIFGVFLSLIIIFFRNILYIKV